MKNILLTAALVLSAITINAQNFHWLKPAGGANNDYATGTAVAPDGRVLTVGHYSATVDFDPGPKVVNCTSQGSYDVFITCFSPSGNFLWVKSIGGSGTENARSIAVDGAGAVYVTGVFAGTTMDIDPGSGTVLLTNASSPSITDGFVAKYSATGNLCWGGSIGGASTDEIDAIDVSGSDVVLTGIFAATADLNPGAASVPFTCLGGYDAFLLRLDTSGTYQWCMQIGAAATDEGKSVRIDNSGNVIIGGSFQQTIDFDLSPATANRTSNGSQDVFIAKYNLNTMALVWATSVGGTAAELLVDIEIDALDNIYYTGNCFGNFDINGGAGTNTVYWAGSSDIFASEIDASGTFVWGWIVGGSFDDEVKGMSLDGSGDIYFTGGFRGTSDFNPGSSTVNIVSTGSNADIFVLKMTTSNTFVWVHKMGISNADEGYDIFAMPNDDYFLCGRFTGLVDMDPTAGVQNFGSVGVSDAFVGKYSTCPYYASSMSASACNTYTSPSGNNVWTTSGTYTDIMQSIGGCDSMITITLTILNPTTSTISASSCATGYTSPSGNYVWTMSGSYMDTISNSIGCDSVITINLTINSATTGTLAATGCASGYTSPSGNHVWNTAGTYMDTIANVAGCDSIITVNLAITAVDLSVTNNAPSLTSNQAGATYQWLDCGNAYAVIPGATSQTFVASVNGNYACAVTFSSCTDTSACESVMNTAIANNDLTSAVSIYPNPNNGDFTYVQNGTETVEVIIYDALGQLVKSFSATPGVQYSLNIETAGMYTVTTVAANAQRSSQRLVVAK